MSSNECDNQAVEKNITISDVTEWRSLCQEIKKIHEDIMTKVENELGRDGAEVKMGVMYAIF